MITILIPILTLVHFLLSVHCITGAEQTKRRLLASYFFGYTCLYYMYAVYHYTTGDILFTGAPVIVQSLIGFFLPSIYYYVCLVTGSRRSLFTLVGLIVLAFLPLPELITLMRYELGHIPAPNTDLNALSLSLDGAHSVTIRLVYLYVILQMVLIGHSAVRLFGRMRQRSLHLTRGARWAFLGLALSCVVLVVEVLIPDAFWRSAVGAQSIVIVNCCLLNGWIYVVTRRLEPNVVRDRSDSETQMDSAQPDQHLGEMLVHLIEDEHVYLDAGFRLEMLVARLNSNRTYVSNAVRQRYHCTLPELLNLKRLEYACELMRTDPSLTLNEVADQSGFSSSSFFGRNFKQRYGLTPSEFRRQLRGG